MKKLFLVVLWLPLAAWAQLPGGILGDVLRSLPKPSPSAPAQGNAAAPGLFSNTSLEEEIEIGRTLAGNLLGAAPLAKDMALQRYVNKVGRWVASQGERPELKWYFGVLDTPDVNAFAMPGGYVFITKGLYDLLSTEAELGGVLGHEVAHVMLQHHLKVYKQSQAVGLIGNVLSQTQSKSALAQAAIGKGAEALTRGLDKGAEFEADQVGVVLATRAGYEPYGLPSVLRKIAQRNPREASLTLLFKTHPLPQERLEKLGDMMGDAFDRYAGAKALPERFSRKQ